MKSKPGAVPIMSVRHVIWGGLVLLTLSAAGSGITTFATSRSIVETRHGIRLIPDQATSQWPAERQVAPFSDHKPAQALDETLAAIATRYGSSTTNVVAMQLEYPR